MEEEKWYTFSENMQDVRPKKLLLKKCDEKQYF